MSRLADLLRRLSRDEGGFSLIAVVGVMTVTGLFLAAAKPSAVM